MRPDFVKIRQLARSADDLNEYIDDFLDHKCSPDDPPYLSDIMIASGQGGQPLLEALSERYEKGRDLPASKRFFWKLQVLRDEWGNPPRPGDVVKLRIAKKLRHREGKPLATNEIMIDVQSGEFDRKWNDYHEYSVDERGCISVEFNDAGNLLRQFGVHGKSGRRISIHPEEHSGDPALCPDGQKRHVWYWRYREVDKEDYAKLPLLEQKSEPKRGYK